eukprot:5605620-Lingulodinium_polyedra.AAC.1
MVKATRSPSAGAHCSAAPGGLHVQLTAPGGTPSGARRAAPSRTGAQKPPWPSGATSHPKLLPSA